LTTMMSDLLTCTACFDPIGPGARPVRLLDLVFHELCAPQCRSCGRRLSLLDESLWRYTARPASDWYGYRVEPVEYWCEYCWDLSGRSESYAQD
jgi:hypothetical protein